MELAVGSVGESLAGFLPAAGGAPHVAVLHPVHLTALLALAANLTTAGERDKKVKRNSSGGLVYLKH